MSTSPDPGLGLGDDDGSVSQEGSQTSHPSSPRGERPANAEAQKSAEPQYDAGCEPQYAGCDEVQYLQEKGELQINELSALFSDFANNDSGVGPALQNFHDSMMNKLFEKAAELQDLRAQNAEIEQRLEYIHQLFSAGKEAILDGCASIAMKPFFANDDLLSLVISKALPAVAPHAVCKQWRDLADAEMVWKGKCIEWFPATADLAGVTNYKVLFARPSGHSLVHALAKPAQPPQLGEYQFLVRLTAGDEVLVDACLSGHDAASQPAFPWMTSLEHRRVFWPVKLPDAAVPGLVNAMGRADEDDLVPTNVGQVLDAVGARGAREGPWLPGQGPWRVSVTTFRAADQRCELLMTSGCMDQYYQPEEGAGDAIMLGNPNCYSSEKNAGRSLDAFELRERGFKIANPSGVEWFVQDVYDDEAEECDYNASLKFYVSLMPRLDSTSGTIEWELELDLQCDGPSMGEDGSWDGGFLELRPVQHSIFLLGLDEAALAGDPAEDE